MALTDLCLRDERPHFCEGTQRTYTLPNGYELSLINFPNAHVFPFAWEGAVINPHGKLDYDTPLTNDVEVFRTEEQTNEWIIRAHPMGRGRGRGNCYQRARPISPRLRPT